MIATVLACAACATRGAADMRAPLVIQAQGSCAASGRTLMDADGKTFHGDHAYVSY